MGVDQVYEESFSGTSPSVPQGLASWHLMLNLALCGSGRGMFS